MNYLDFLILIPAVWFAYKGFTHGLIRELFSLIALFLGIFLSFKFTDFIAEWIGNEKIPHAVYSALSFLIVLIIVFFIGRIVEKIIKLVIPELINNLAGAIFAVGKVLTVCSMLIFFMETLDTHELFFKAQTKENSFLYPHTQPIVPKIQNWYEKNRIHEKIPFEKAKTPEIPCSE